MKNIFVLSILFLIVSCQKKAEVSDMKTQISQSKSINDENFVEFFERFNNDSIFQIQRIDFPIKIVELNTESLKEDTLELNKINYYIQKINKNQKDYSIEKVIKSDSATVLLKGIDNGIYKEVFFLKKKGLWKLITWNDLST